MKHIFHASFIVVSFILLNKFAVLGPTASPVLGNGIALLLCGHLYLCLCHLGDLDDDAVRARNQTCKRNLVHSETH